MENTTPEYTIEQRRDFPALYGRPVTAMHTKICLVYGHATHLSDGVDRGMCPRCGEVKPGFEAEHSVVPLDEPRPAFTTSAKVNRTTGQAEEVPGWLSDMRATNSQLALVLRQVGGIKLDFDEHPDAQLPLPVPGALIEGARFATIDGGFSVVELTLWARDEMITLQVGQQTEVLVYGFVMEDN